MNHPRYDHKFAYDILALKKGETVLDKWEHLRAYPELVQHGSKKNDCWLRYAILLTDVGSGLLKGIADIDTRHKEALRLAGIESDDPRAAGALEMKDEPIGELCYAWLKMQNAFELAYIFSGERMLWQDLRSVAESVEYIPEEKPAPPGETATEKKQRLNREAWAGRIDNSEKTGKARTTRGTLFDNLPDRIEKIKKARLDFFNGDKKVEEAVVHVSRLREGRLEQYVNEKRNGHDGN